MPSCASHGLACSECRAWACQQHQPHSVKCRRSWFSRRLRELAEELENGWLDPLAAVSWFGSVPLQEAEIRKVERLAFKAASVELAPIENVDEILGLPQIPWRERRSKDPVLYEYGLIPEANSLGTLLEAVPLDIPVSLGIFAQNASCDPTQDLVPGFHDDDDEEWLVLPDGLPSPDETLIDLERVGAVDRALRTLTPREEKMIKMYFGIHGAEYSLDEIAQSFAISTTTARRLVQRGLRKPRHPSRSRSLLPFVG